MNAAEQRVPRRSARVALALSASMLALAVAAQGMRLVRPARTSRPPHLERAIPSDAPGWSGRDVPLGANEFLSSEAEKVLNFDEVVNREFTRGGEKFGVYVAYWSAGKMPTQVVASHTPDRCWTENGWHCTAMRFRQDRNFDGAPLQPAEWRTFEPPEGGPPTYVLYWHLVGGQAQDFGSRFSEIPDPVRWWEGVVRQAVSGQGEQYFIRVTASEPLEELWRDPGFAAVFRSLVRLGLDSRPPPL